MFIQAVTVIVHSRRWLLAYTAKWK